jgi:hypothetical protein
MSRLNYVIIFIYPVLIVLVAGYAAHLVFPRIFSSYSTTGDVYVSNEAQNHNFTKPEDFALAYLEAYDEAAQTKVRYQGGDILHPFLDPVYFETWSKSYLNIENKEIISTTESGTGRWNVEIRAIRSYNTQPTLFTFIVSQASSESNQPEEVPIFQISEIREKCNFCEGTGKVPCYSCGGTGSIESVVEDTDRWGYRIGTHVQNVACTDCGGSGKINCSVCNAIGYNQLNPDLTFISNGYADYDM